MPGLRASVFAQSLENANSPVLQRPGDWTCPACNFSNWRKRLACLRCSIPRPSIAASKATSSRTTEPSIRAHALYPDTSRETRKESSQSRQVQPTEPPHVPLHREANSCHICSHEPHVGGDGVLPSAGTFCQHAQPVALPYSPDERHAKSLHLQEFGLSTAQSTRSRSSGSQRHLIVQDGSTRVCFDQRMLLITDTSRDNNSTSTRLASTDPTQIISQSPIRSSTLHSHYNATNA